MSKKDILLDICFKIAKKINHVTIWGLALLIHKFILISTLVFKQRLSKLLTKTFNFIVQFTFSHKDM